MKGLEPFQLLDFFLNVRDGQSPEIYYQPCQSAQRDEGKKEIELTAWLTLDLALSMT